ncbi:hypothetical protein BH10PSE18_BH10PSE18_04590 [soil metagenome]|jgi:hypothetical protein
MKRSIVLLSIAALAGCSSVPGMKSSPDDVEATQGLQFAATGKPWDVAGCVDRNVKKSLPSMFVARTAEDGRGMKVTVNSDVGTAGIVTIQPAGTGSRVIVKLSSYYIFRGSVAGKMVSDC